jgi:hypothetical protein
VNACVGGFDDTLIGLCASAVEKLGESQSLGIKSPTLFRCSDSKWHKIFPPAQNSRLVPFTLPSRSAANPLPAKVRQSPIETFGCAKDLDLGKQGFLVDMPNVVENFHVDELTWLDALPFPVLRFPSNN